MNGPSFWFVWIRDHEIEFWSLFFVSDESSVADFDPVVADFDSDAVDGFAVLGIEVFKNATCRDYVGFSNVLSNNGQHIDGFDGFDAEIVKSNAFESTVDDGLD